MKTIIHYVCALLAISLLAGCATSNSGQASNASPTISGYVDTSAQKHF